MYDKHPMNRHWGIKRVCFPESIFVEVVIMTIKNIVYSAHQKLKNVTTPPIKQTHIYELFAASFGFNSYASLKSVAILAILVEPVTLNQDMIKQRASALGYTEFPSENLIGILEQEALGAIPFKELASRLNEGVTLSNSDLEQLSAAKTNAWAHYCLALHYLDTEEDDEQLGSKYWYQQMQSGHKLSGVEKEWALAYKAQLSKSSKYEFHLRQAASLGCDLALLDLAENFDDASVFDNNHQFISADPMRVAEVAENLDRHQDQHHWLTVAAKAGNIEAMRELIEVYDSNDLVLCWTWVYLSRLLDHDLTKDNHIGIHDDGSDYDDDIGGPMYVGGTEGVDLEPLIKEQDEEAQLAAKSLFEHINKS